MSSSYTANQYENAFKSHRLQNWTVPKHFKQLHDRALERLEPPILLHPQLLKYQRPSAAEGHTTFIATDRGHLLPGVKRGSTWTSFQGTWDLPNHIPPVHINPTARSLEGKMRIKSWGQSQRLVLSATDKPQERSRANSRTCNKKTDEEVQTPASIPVPDGQEPTAEKPSSQAQSRPETQQSQAPSRPVTQQSHAESRPASQQNVAESRPTSPQSQAQSRPVSPDSRTGQ